eukprot:gnl/TRDRNA2_/TRDRNA2_131445_c0_seq12.p1 gnl/TRDRNA2_/TRDRNA2_131445_c0~~gnl/TRDRNA2_/TRDRNA2_131445_c0_seq12.p1  ORF type:complete len:897 (-),score=197.93 gnl/TRDRNA2_/TRDRNA2_131445_c0_seq12:231-2810(-)
MASEGRVCAAQAAIDAGLKTVELEMCEPGSGGGLVLPLGGDGEQNWPNGLRIILYLLGLGWCFLGVAIVADVFMGAIEKVTSQRRRVFDAKTQKFRTYLIWNPTVANLTLMALGSSAPEILLNVIELMGNNFYAGSLGPSTIVGSAAFNLFCICAVCVVAISPSEVRYIKEFGVYVLTGVFSVWAYVWLIVILILSSPDIIEPWEGIVTFLYFPILVFLAWAMDKGYFSKEKPELACGRVLDVDMTKEEIAEVETRIRKEHGQDLTHDQVMQFILMENTDKASRAKQRVAATRMLVGGKRVKIPQLAEAQKITTNAVSSIAKGDLAGTLGPKKVVPVNNEEESKPVTTAVIEFQSVKYACLENAGTVTLNVVRSGIEDITASVKYKTREGTAKAGSDYIEVGDELVFEAGEKEKQIVVKLVDDAGYEENEEFYVDLLETTSKNTTIGVAKTATVVVIDDDLPGVLLFKEDDVKVQEGMGEDKEVEIQVVRQQGSTGKVSCKYKTEDDTAKAGTDYEAAEGTLEFDNGEMCQTIKVTIKPVGRYERTEMFRILLTEPEGGVRFCANTDGGDEHNICTVIIEGDGQSRARVDQIFGNMKATWDKQQAGHANYLDQFKDAIYVNGGGDEGEEGEEFEPPGPKDYIMHAITFPWKLLFATIPPTDYGGGWVCFFCALAMIGVVTVFIGDMAGLLGCCLGIRNEITAITFVALGTSLPDTFASKAAAISDPYADASIVNVTGSNSVNVFLGLGLPWMIGSLYWTGGQTTEWYDKYCATKFDFAQPFIADGTAAFVVQKGALAFSVIVFCCCAVVCFSVLGFRRKVVGGELGGASPLREISAGILVCLWFTYVGLSSWNTTQQEK